VGQPSRAWVLNTAANTVSLVDVSNPANLAATDTVALEDPAHPAVKRGRMAFDDLRFAPRRLRLGEPRTDPVDEPVRAGVPVDPLELHLTVFAKESLRMDIPEPERFARRRATFAVS
jgi:hypothetical protein